MFQIQTSRDLKGSVTISGSKNAALPLLASALLVKGKTHFSNVPNILDVHDFIHFYESLGAIVSLQNNELTIDASTISQEHMDSSMIARTRAGIYFIAGLLSRFGEARIPIPGGDKIGKRPIDEHLNGYKAMGYTVKEKNGSLILSGSPKQGGVTINAYFAVTATANLIMGAATRDGTTTIQLAAFEPHIFNLIDFLRKSGVSIDIRYDHTIIVHGISDLHTDISEEVISDYLQSGTFAIIGALCAEEYIDIKRARIDDLTAFLYKLHEAGVRSEDIGNDTLRVYRANTLKAVNIQTNIFPGFPTDLMPLFAVLMTQCEGTSRIFEILYESRLNWLVEFEPMGGNVRIVNPHEAKITGITPLHGATVNSWDLRSGAAMVIAGMIANGTTTVENIYWINRGYDNLIGKLKSLGAKIQEI